MTGKRPTAYAAAVELLTASLAEYGPPSAAVVAAAAIVQAEAIRDLREHVEKLTLALGTTATALHTASAAFGAQQKRSDD